MSSLYLFVYVIHPFVLYKNMFRSANLNIFGMMNLRIIFEGVFI